MKKFKKILSLCFVVILALSLCSCRAIDEMRKSRALYTDEGKTKITVGEETFVLVENLSNDFDLEFEYDEALTVSQKDVPLLAAQFVGDSALYAQDYRIICVDYSAYYVREDVYEYAKGAKIENLTHYCYQYYDEENFEHDYAYLEENFIKNVEDVIKNTKPKYEVPEISTWVSLYKTDKAMLFMSYYADVNLDVDGKITISIFDDESGRDSYYTVPDDKASVFASFVKENSTGIMYFE